MGHSGDSFRYFVFATSLILAFVFWRREIIDAIEAFRNNFPRGGPRNPSHPLPAGDAVLLRRKRRKQG